MARSISQIYAQIIEEKNNQTVLAQLNSPISVSIYILWARITATCIWMHEKMFDFFTTEIDGKIAKAGVGSPNWLIAQVFNFQYNADVLQVFYLSTDNFTVLYESENKDYKIITRCALVERATKLVELKTAKGLTVPEKLTSQELAALQSYLDLGMHFAGTKIIAYSYDPDRLFVAGLLKYDGQFINIKASVKLALQNYCATLSQQQNFGGKATYTDIIAVIKNTEGVIDFNCTEMAGRSSSTAFASRTKFYNLATGVNNFNYPAFSGYFILEDTVGQTIESSITYEPNEL